MQDDLSETVAIAATNAGLKKDMFAEELPPNRQPISIEGITIASDNMLVFASQTDFDTLMSTLVNHYEEDIDAWEQSLGFLSMRRNWEIIKEDPSVDDLAIDNERIPDPWFESIVNPEGRVQVAGTIYDFDFNNDRATIYYPTGITEDIELGNRGGSSCSGHIDQCSRQYTMPGLTQHTTGNKWNRWYVFYASVGANVMSYRYQQISNTYSQHYVNKLQFMIDHWYKLRFRLCSFGPYITITNHTVIRFDHWKHSYSWGWSSGFPTANRWDVPEYGRVHHWIGYDWNLDCHTNLWWQ